MNIPKNYTMKTLQDKFTQEIIDSYKEKKSITEASKAVTILHLQSLVNAYSRMSAMILDSDITAIEYCGIRIKNIEQQLKDLQS